MNKIVDQYGHPIDTGVLKDPQTSRVARLRNEYLTSNLDGITPARLAVILKNADNGDLWAQHRLFSDMEERDAHLAAEMGKRKLALLSLDWSIVAPRNASAEEKAHADWLTEVLTDAVDPIEDLILALMDGVGHGFAPVELEWRTEGKEWLPAFVPRPQEWFRLDSDRREIRLRDESADGTPPAPFGWVFHTHGKAKTGYLSRLGLHRVLSWPFIYKAYAIGDFAEFLETFGLPIIVGKYFSGAGPEEKASLMRAVTALGHDARAIMPQEMQLEVQKITGGTSSNTVPHMIMVDWAERSESKCILGQTMSAESKASGLGSGNAELHREVRRDILKADAREIAGTLTRDLLYPLIALNRGNIDGLARCPRFIFDTGEAEDIKLFSEALPELVGVGMKIPVAWAHEKLRIPEPAEDEEVLQVASPPNVLNPELRPEPGKATPKEKPDKAVLAALAARDARKLAEQDAIDELAEHMAGDWEPVMDPMLDAIRQLLASSGSLEEFRDRLPEIIGQMDTDALTRLAADGMFAAHLAGRAIPGKPDHG
jgi:phage gp29-like protein